MGICGIGPLSSYDGHKLTSPFEGERCPHCGGDMVLGDDTMFCPYCIQGEEIDPE